MRKWTHSDPTLNLYGAVCGANERGHARIHISACMEEMLLRQWTHLDPFFGLHGRIVV